MRYRLHDGIIEIYIEPEGWVELQTADPSLLVHPLMVIVDDLQKQIEKLKEERFRPFNPNVYYPQTC